MEYGFLLFLSILALLLSIVAILIVIFFLPSVSTNASEANDKTVWTSGTTKSVIDANTIQISNTPSPTTVYSSLKVEELDGQLATRIKNIILNNPTPQNPQEINDKTWPISILNNKFEDIGKITAEQIIQNPIYFQQLVDALVIDPRLANTIIGEQAFKDELQFAVDTYAQANLENIINDYLQSSQDIIVNNLQVNSIVFNSIDDILPSMNGSLNFNGTMTVYGTIQPNIIPSEPLGTIKATELIDTI